MNCCNQNSSELELYFDSPQSFKESQELAQLSRSDQLKLKREKQKQMNNLSTQIQELNKYQIRKMKNREAAQASREKKKYQFHKLCEESHQLKQLILQKDEQINYLHNEIQRLSFLLFKHEEFELQEQNHQQINFEEQYSIAPEEITFQSQSPVWQRAQSPIVSKRQITSLGVLGLFSLICMISVLQGPIKSKDTYLVDDHDSYIPSTLQIKIDCQRSLNESNVIAIQNQQQNQTIDQQINNKNNLIQNQIAPYPFDVQTIKDEFNKDNPQQRIVLMQCKLRQLDQYQKILEFIINQYRNQYDQISQGMNESKENEIILFNMNGDIDQDFLQTIECEIKFSCHETFNKDKLQ